MKLKASFFNIGLSKSLIKRFWPLWLGWFALLIVQLPLSMAQYATDVWSADYLNRNIVSAGVSVVYFSALACVLSVMAVFSHLYSRRDCGLINSMPVKRKCAFITSAVTGLLPLLLFELLTYLITLAAFSGNERFDVLCLNQWLYAVLLGTLAFYGIAVFCAMLTGNVLAVPVLFVALNFFAAFVEDMLFLIMNDIIYGFAGYDKILTVLSPLETIADNLYTVNPLDVYGEFSGSPYINGLSTLGIYALIGLLLLPVAYLFYRNRKMETAGDFIAVGWLRPAFKYCVAICSALLCNYVILDLALNNVLKGAKLAVMVGFLLCLGAAVGFYAAQMLLDKTLKVFRTNAWGLVVLCVLFVGFVAGCELDLTGYERYIPAEDDILSVTVMRHSPEGQVSDANAIELYRQIHQTIIDNKAHNEASSAYFGVSLEYTLKDGSKVSRSYYVDSAKSWVDSGSSELPIIQQFCLLPIVKETVNSTVTPISVENFIYGYVENTFIEDSSYYSSEEFKLTPEQAVELYNTCIIPDMQDSSLCNVWAYSDDARNAITSSAYLSIVVASTSPEQYNNRNYIGIDITLDATRTLAWLKENLDYEPEQLNTIYDYDDMEFYTW